MLWMILATTAVANQTRTENRVAQSLARSFGDYEILNPNSSATSLLQLLGMTNVQQLIRLEDAFRPFTTNSGFQGSILEKYYFPTNQPALPGRPQEQIVLISSKPYIDESDRLSGFAVVRTAGGFNAVKLTENQVRKLIGSGVMTFSPPLTPSILRPPPEPDWIEELKQKYPHVRAEIEAAERAERERKSRIAARVGELSRAATNEAATTGTGAEQAQPQPSSAGGGDASNRRGLVLWAGLGAALLAVTGAILLRRRRG